MPFWKSIKSHTEKFLNAYFTSVLQALCCVLIPLETTYLNLKPHVSMSRSQHTCGTFSRFCYSVFTSSTNCFCLSRKMPWVAGFHIFLTQNGLWTYFSLLSFTQPQTEIPLLLIIHLSYLNSHHCPNTCLLLAVYFHFFTLLTIISMKTSSGSRIHHLPLAWKRVTRTHMGV